MILALVAFWGNLLAALLYGVMAVLQLRHWHGDSLNRPLVGAFAVMSVWAIFLAMLPGYAMLPQLAEAARNIAFLAFMYGIMPKAADSRRSRRSMARSPRWSGFRSSSAA